jgi:hypothetical protein
LIENYRNLILFKVDGSPLVEILEDEDGGRILHETGNGDGDGEHFRW